ncbi:hypothetical protein [Rhizobium sp. Leaf262]|uniref:hypothetical protein n=1 Tax=Rhizobium sp. Leaf262 TaxID=1736312 RepID=UPI0007151DCD|nr:hypothetical protein [Rhizobium sp. Leaf262]KQO79098.1 hypothetical protein ASF29_05125 [Rhizobium sp. Leaf262]
MSLPDREKRCGLKDEVLAGEYVLGALTADARAELAKRMKTDRQFAAMVRRWQDNLTDTDRHERRSFSSYVDASKKHERHQTHDRLHQRRYRRFSIVAALWNSVRFWRLATSAALLWAAVLLFTFPSV